MAYYADFSDDGSDYATLPNITSYPDGHGYRPGYVSVPKVDRHSADSWYDLGFDGSQKAGVGCRSQRLYDPVPPLASHSNAYDLPFSKTSSSTSMGGSGFTWDFTPMPAYLPFIDDTRDPSQPPRRRGHTQSACKSTGAINTLLCLYPNCEYVTKRQYDLDRHQKTHFPSNPGKKFDCTDRGCGRTGEYGFDREDHLTEHLRNVHAKDISNRPKKQKTFDCPVDGCSRSGTDAFTSRDALQLHRLDHSLGKLVPTKQEVFDCPEDGCYRRSFSRRDTLKDHLRRMHKKVVSRDSIQSREELEAAG